jgi:hypothetical protein
MTSPQQQQEFEAAHPVSCRRRAGRHAAAPAPPTVNVNAVAVKLLEFWPADPQTWFHQAEAAFRRSNVVTSYTLLDMPPLGDRCPSHLMHEMLAQLPTGENKDGAIFLGIFLRKLPATMRDHLAAANHATAAAMAAHADVLWDASCGEPTISHLVDATTTAVAAMNVSKENRRRSPDRRLPDRRSPDRRRRQSRQGRRQTPGPDSRRRDSSALCYYHSRFGQRAMKCEAPCSWTEN